MVTNGQSINKTRSVTGHWKKKQGTHLAPKIPNPSPLGTHDNLSLVKTSSTIQSQNDPADELDTESDEVFIAGTRGISLKQVSGGDE